MRSTRFYATLLTLSLFAALTSCKKTADWFPSTEDKLVGEWTFSKVTYQGDLSFANTDCSDEYLSRTLTFTEDQTLVESDVLSAVERSGTWEVSHFYVGNGDAANTAEDREQLDAALVDAETGEVELINGDFLTVTKQRLTFQERKNQGVYRYVLKKN